MGMTFGRSFSKKELLLFGEHVPSVDYPHIVVKIQWKLYAIWGELLVIA